MNHGESRENKEPQEQAGKRRAVIAVRILLTAVFLLFVLYAAARIFLSTSYAAAMVSDYLTGLLHQRVVVSGLALSGATVTIKGIRVDNPEGFPTGALISANSLSIDPAVLKFLTGNRVLNLLQADGMKVDLRKNQAGVWNYSGIADILSRKEKKPSPELLIRRLLVRDSSLAIAGFKLENFALTVKDFSAKGLTATRFVITGSDVKGEPFRIEADGKMGKNPVLRLSLSAPRISAEAFSVALKEKSIIDPGKGYVNLSLAAEYHSGVAEVKGTAGFEGIGLVLKGRKPLLRGNIDFAGRYMASRKEASLDRAAIIINDHARFDASATVRKVTGDTKFTVQLASNRIPIAELRKFLPPETARNMTFNGTLECRELRLSGSGTNGIESGGGKILLRNGEAVKAGKTLFKRLSSDMAIKRTADGWNLEGALSMNARAGEVPLENMNARFRSRLTGGFKLISIEVPNLKAGLMGVPVHGKLTYSAKEREPYRGMFHAKNTRLSTLNRLLGRKKEVIVSGTADLSVRGRGRGLSSFTGDMEARIRGLKGRVSGKDFSVGNVKAASHFTRSRSGITASGKVVAEKGNYSGRNFAAAFDYSLVGDRLELLGGRVAIDRGDLRFAKIRGLLPFRQAGARKNRYPLVFAVSGLDLSRGEFAAKGISGNISGVFSPAAGVVKLTGSASLAVPFFSYQKLNAGSLKIHAEMSGEGTVANLEGMIFGGGLSSVVKSDPFSITKGVSFKGELQDVQAVEMSKFLPDRMKIKFPSGRINAGFDGNWSEKEGLRTKLQVSGSGMSFAFKKGKTILSGAEIALRADVTGSDLTISNAVMGRGEAVSVKVAGKLEKAASPSRSGNLSFDLGSAPVNSLLDTFANILPKALQEADGGGLLGARGTLLFKDGKVELDGKAKFDKARLDIPSQKLSISEIDGIFPFSLVLAGDKVAKPADELYFSRENYPTLLKTLRKEAKGDFALKIGKLQLGALETDEIRLRVKAGAGRIEIVKVESLLYGGAVIGNGWFYLNKGPVYSADILVNDLSLNRFCNSYPAAKGYISGLLDGVVSLYGEKGGLPGLAGFVELWAHEGKGEEMLVSKEFLQKMAGRNLKGFFFRDDRPYDHGEISAYLLDGYVTFEKLDISHTNFLGMKDLSVSVAPVQNRIELGHLLQSIKEAAARGKTKTGEPASETPVQPDIKWLE